MRVYSVGVSSLVLVLWILSTWILVMYHDDELATDTVSLLQHIPIVKPLTPKLESWAAKRNNWIPLQLVMTGSFSSLEDLPLEAKANLNNTRSLAPGFSMRYLNDTSCRTYLSKYAGDEFVEIYDREIHGSFKGDICRSAVLLQEGGFYADLDFQFHDPLASLIGENTTFMTAFVAQTSWSPVLPPSDFGPSPSAVNRPILNALIAVRPKSLVMKRTMKFILKAYAKHNKLPALLGPTAMGEALRETVHQDCPDISLSNSDTLAQWTCGEESMRFYQEEYIGAGNDCINEGPLVCPPERAASEFGGLNFGVFRMGSESRNSRLIGWPRYKACATFGCNINGGQPSL